MGTCRVALYSKLVSQTVVNVFTFHSETEVTPLVSDVILYLEDFWHAGLLALITGNWSSNYFDIQIPNGTGGFTTYTSVDYNTLHGGSVDSGNFLPYQSAGLLTAVLPGRRRGKKYIAGILEAGLYLGSPTPELASAMATSGAAYIAPLSGETEWLSGVCKPDGSEFAEFTGYRIGSWMATQRRRKPGIGI